MIRMALCRDTALKVRSIYGFARTTIERNVTTIELAPASRTNQMGNSCPFNSVMRAVLLLVVMAVQTQSIRCAELGGSQEKLMATTRRPTTTVGVLRNLKVALDNDLFLRDDFYTDENLRNFFAANKISWTEVTSARTSGYVYTQYSEVFFLIRGMIDEKWNVVAHGQKKRGGGTINAGMSADSIIDLFGKPMRITDPYAADNWSHPTALMEKTHEFGNLAIEYKFDRPTSTASFNCRFNGDGTVNGCSFGNAEK